MKPITILHSEWSNGWGGQEIRIVEEMAGMAARGHRVLLCTRPKTCIAARGREMGFKVIEMPMRSNMDFAAAARLAGLTRREKVDFLHTHSSVDSWLGGWAKHIFRAPCHLVRTKHIGHIKTNLLNIIYKMPAHVISVGGEMARRLVEEYGLPADKVSSIPTGVNPNRFKPDPPDEHIIREFGLKPDEDIVAMVAILRNWKRHDLFCQMAKKLVAKRPDTRFLIVGGGPGWNRVNGYLDDMDLRGNVIMTNHREDVERILSVVKVVVLTSEEMEGASQSLSQALICEKGVVAVDKGSISDLVKDGQTGFLVPFGDLDAMAQKVAELLDKPELRQKMAKAGRQLVLDNFTINHTVEGTEAVYQKVMDQAG